MRLEARKTWIAVHKYIGLVLGILLFLNALSGAALVYVREIAKLGADDLTSAELTSDKLPLSVVATRVSQLHPDRTLLLIKHREMQASAPIVAVFADSDGRQFEHFFNPYNAQSREERPAGKSVMGIIYEFHANILMGKVGRYAVAVLALVLTTSLISGVVLWWPRSRYVGRAFRISLRSPRFWVHLHSVPAIYTVPAALLLAITGFVLALPEWFDKTDEVATAWGDDVAIEGRNIARSVASAQELFPGAEPYSLQFPADAGITIVRLKVPPKFGYANDKTIAIRSDGRVLWVRDHSTMPTVRRIFEVFAIEIHSGQIAGAVGQLLVFIAGTIISLIVILGFVIFFRNRCIDHRHKASV